LVERYGERANNFLESGQRLSEIEQAAGRPYAKIVADAADKERQRKEDEVQIEALRREEGTIRASIPDLQRLRGLSDTLSRNRITPDQLDVIIERGKMMEALGFTQEAAGFLAVEFSKLGIDPRKASESVAQLLKANMNLETSVAKLQARRQKLVEINDKLMADVYRLNDKTT
jgi:cell division protein FtsB